MAKTKRRASTERGFKANTKTTEHTVSQGAAAGATTQPVDGGQDASEQEPNREDAIHDRALRKFEAAKRSEYRKAPTERTSDNVLWKQAHKEAKKEDRNERIRKQVRQQTGRAATAARGEASSLWARNRTLAAPWCLAAPYAAAGQIATLAASQPGAVPAGIAGVTAAVAGAGSWLAWRTPLKFGNRFQRRKLRERVPSGFAPKVQAGMGLACGWDAAMPLVHGAAGHTGMWLALLAGTSYLGLSWWHTNAHPIPEELPEQPAEQPTDPDSEVRRVRELVSNWETKVSPKLVPGSKIEFHSGSTEAVLSFLITLDADEGLTRSGVKNELEKIAMKLGVFESKVSFETGQHPAQLIMHIREQEPVFIFDEPVVLCDGKRISSRWEITPGSTVDIAFGSYIDGSGYASVRFMQKGSVNSTFILGEMGSGKTRALEIIAVALRMLGCYLLWLDGQEGASSPLLNDYADEVFSFNMHDRNDEKGVREFTQAIGDISRQRNRSLQKNPELGGEYTYDPARPPVVALMDEAHEAFQTVHPTARTYGLRLESYAVQLRKLGMAVVALSQDYDKTNTFGQSSRLRGSLVTAGNMLAFRVTDRSRIGMLPSTCPKLDALPGRGYGYLPLQDRPDAMWRTLDLGDDVQGTLRTWMDRYEPGTLEFDRDTVAMTEETPQGNDSTPHAATSGAGGAGNVVRFFGPASATPAPEPEQSEPAKGKEATPAEQRTLGVLLDEGEHTRSSLAKLLGITPQVAGKQLNALVDKGYAVRTETGYQALTGTGQD